MADGTSRIREAEVSTARINLEVDTNCTWTATGRTTFSQQRSAHRTSPSEEYENCGVHDFFRKTRCSVSAPVNQAATGFPETSPLSFSIQNWVPGPERAPENRKKGLLPASSHDHISRRITAIKLIVKGWIEMDDMSSKLSEAKSVLYGRRFSNKKMWNTFPYLQNVCVFATPNAQISSNFFWIELADSSFSDLLLLVLQISASLSVFRSIWMNISRNFMELKLRIFTKFHENINESTSQKNGHLIQRFAEKKLNFTKFREFPNPMTDFISFDHLNPTLIYRTRST